MGWDGMVLTGWNGREWNRMSVSYKLQLVHNVVITEIKKSWIFSKDFNSSHNLLEKYEAL